MNLTRAKTPDEREFQRIRNKSYEESHRDHEELLRPTPTDAADYILDICNGPMTALGYGNLRADYPLELLTFQRRSPQPDDVTIQIDYCGVCHSDWHVIRNEWKNTKYPIIVGHEIIGRVICVGNRVTKHRVGESVAVGPNVDSCRKCPSCSKGYEQYCENDVTEAYNQPERYPNEIKPTGPISQGGYSNIIIVNEHYVLKLPFLSDYSRVAPLLCAGITMYTPLKYAGLHSRARVGIAGLGGLGHLGVKLAKSMGYEVIVLTTTREKIDDGLDLGADQVLWVQNLAILDAYKKTFDLIISTIPFNHDINTYLELLKPQGLMWVVGSMYSMTVDFDLVNRRGLKIHGSSTGGIKDTQECIDYCIEKDIYADVVVIDIKDINATHQKIVDRSIRYRYVVDLTQR
ncbi:Zn-dependent alcohol dehydrogenase [uncultured virus]|nr:Zn-dependent alcohol dehydrogenase [uncultured virus]